jgi:DNA repair exonuclease SbcCD ATPase subunit
MNRLGSILLALFFLLLPAVQLRAQSDDPSDTFLKAYMTSQQGEKLEHDNQFKAALAKYRSAGSLIEDLRKNHGDWQPAIVEYRGRKISESILRVQDKAATQSDLAAGSTPLPETAPASDNKPAAVGPTSEVSTSRSSAPAPQVPSETAIKEATKKLNDKIDQLQTDLQKSRSQLENAQKEKESLSGRLKETSSKLTQAQSELDKSKGAERQAHDQLAKAQDTLKKAEASGSPAKSQPALQAEIARLKDALTAAQEARLAAEKAKEQAGAKATEASKQIASVTKERDAALTQLKGVKEPPEKRVQVLIAENIDLKQKLASAEKSMRELNADKPKKEKELADVKAQLEQLLGQLAASQKQNKE